MQPQPDRIVFETGDCSVLALGRVCHLIIQLELDYAEHLDADRLSRALRLALDAEPILAHRSVYDPVKPYWVPVNPDEFKLFFFTEDRTEYDRFRDEVIDSKAGPQIKAMLLRESDGDHLLLKVAHEAADAGGTKEIARLVTSIYNRLNENPDYKPEPNVSGSRSIKQIMNRVPWYAYPRLYLRYLRENWRNYIPKMTLSLPLPETERTPVQYLVRYLSPERIAPLAEYGRAREATLNDMILAAHLHALVKQRGWDGKHALRLATTIDLRRYLPGERGEAICNLSGLEFTRFGPEPGDDFAATLDMVVRHTKRQKAFYIGLNNYVGLTPTTDRLKFETVLKIFDSILERGMRVGNLAHSITNMGPIKVEDVTFGEAKPLRAFLLPPPGFPPNFLSGVSGYDGSLTIAVGTHPDLAETLSDFLDAMLAELPDGNTSA